jgi:multidrug efflux system membrane fusion protein
VSPSVLVLNDEGRLSVRTVDGGTVAVRPITIVDDAEEGVWVTGLPQRTDIVFVGDTTVHHGQQVEVVAMDDGADA